MDISRVLLLVLAVFFTSGCATVSTISSVLSTAKFISETAGEQKKEEPTGFEIEKPVQTPKMELPEGAELRIDPNIKERMVPPTWLVGLFLVSFILMLINTVRERLRKKE